MQNRQNWLPWILVGVVALALIGFLLFGGNNKKSAPVEKPSYSVANKNGVTDIVVKTPVADFSYTSDEVAQVKKNAREKKRVQDKDKFEKYRKSGTSQSAETDVIVEKLTSIDSRIGNLEKEVKTLNDGFNTINTNLVLINSSVGSVEKTVKNEGKKTRVTVRESILNLPHSISSSSGSESDSVFRSGYNSGYNRNQKR